MAKKKKKKRPSGLTYNQFTEFLNSERSNSGNTPARRLVEEELLGQAVKEMKQEELRRITAPGRYTNAEAFRDSRGSHGDLWRSAKDHTKQDRRT